MLNYRSPLIITTFLNLLKMYALPELTQAGAAWAPYLQYSHWWKLEAVQTIGIRLITTMPSYVWNKKILISAATKTLEGSIRREARSLIYKKTMYNHYHIHVLIQDLSSISTQATIIMFG